MTVIPQQKPRILVFDSGLGGLSIVSELTASRLDADVYYFADTAFFPYGEKSDAALIARIPSLMACAVAATDANLVIIACNTASTLALDDVRTRVKVPVVGVVPAIKPAAALTNTGVIGLLATPNTVMRPYTDKLIADFAQGKRVIRHGALGLAGVAEKMLSGSDLDLDIVRASVAGLFHQTGGDEIDVVVLACTHYPHVQRQLAAFAPREVIWIDSGAAIARRVRALLGIISRAAPSLRLALTTGGEDGSTIQGLASWGFSAARRLKQSD